VNSLINGLFAMKKLFSYHFTSFFLSIFCWSTILSSFNKFPSNLPY